MIVMVQLFSMDKRILTQKDIDEMTSLYNQGDSYEIIAQKTKRAKSTICKYLSCIARSGSDARKLAIAKNRYVLSDDGRRRLSQAGKKSIRNSRMVWTKPEREFRQILNEEGIGVAFPDYMKDIFNVEDDLSPEVYAQYPIQRYVCDFVDSRRKIVYRVNGDFWHANPLLYDKSKLTKIQENNVRHDVLCKTYLESKGFKVVDVWQSEIEWNKELVITKIRATRGTANPPILQVGFTQFDSGVAHQDWSDKIKKLWFKPKRTEIHYVSKKCQICGIEYKVKENVSASNKFCSLKCSGYAKRKSTRPSAEELAIDLSKMTYVAIGKKYGVTDNAIKKWARAYGIELFPRRKPNGQGR